MRKRVCTSMISFPRASLILLAISFYACIGSNDLSAKLVNNRKVNLFTWNEDTTRPYKLVLYDESYFWYGMTLQKNNGKQVRRSFTGSYTYNSDTIFLKYQNKVILRNIKPFLIREISGSYLIQQFSDSTPRVYFRLNNGRHNTYHF